MSKKTCSLGIQRERSRRNKDDTGCFIYDTYIVVWGIYNIQVWKGRNKIFKIQRHDLQVGLPHIVEDMMDVNP
jgi:hypothetical protein